MIFINEKGAHPQEKVSLDIEAFSPWLDGYSYEVNTACVEGEEVATVSCISVCLLCSTLDLWEVVTSLSLFSVSFLFGAGFTTSTRPDLNVTSHCVSLVFPFIEFIHLFPLSVAFFVPNLNKLYNGIVKQQNCNFCLLHTSQTRARLAFWTHDVYSVVCPFPMKDALTYRQKADYIYL
jgi:hypothetical protein